MQLPSHHQTVMPYLMLHNAEAFLEFTKQVFKADTVSIDRLENTIRHGEVKIGNSTIMFTQANAEWAPATANLFVYVNNADDSFAKAISHGASIVMELSNQSYGRTCGVKDPSDNVWWITSIIKI